MLRVRATGSGWTGAPGLMTFYFRPSGSGTNAEATEGAARVRAALNSAITSMPIGVTWQVSGQVDVLDDANGSLTGTLSVADPAVVTGTGTGGQAAPALAALIKMGTAGVIRGRRLQGRRFFSPLNGGSVTTTGVLVAGSQTNLVTSFGLLQTQITTPLTQVVWARPSLLGSGTSSPVTATSVPTKLAVLRSRRD